MLRRIVRPTLVEARVPRPRSPAGSEAPRHVVAHRASPRGPPCCPLHRYGDQADGSIGGDARSGSELSVDRHGGNSARPIRPTAYSDRDDSSAGGADRRTRKDCPYGAGTERSSVSPAQLSDDRCRAKARRKPLGPNAVRAVRPEATVLVPGVDPVSVTEDAQPVQAIRNAARATASTHAIQRMSPQTETGAPKSVPAERRPNRVARTRTGTFAPESTVLAPEPMLSATSEAAPAGKPAPSRAIVDPAAPDRNVSQRPSGPPRSSERRLGRIGYRRPVRPDPRLRDVGDRLDTAPPQARQRRSVGRVVCRRTIRPCSHRKATMTSAKANMQ